MDRRFEVCYRLDKCEERDQNLRMSKLFGKTFIISQFNPSGCGSVILKRSFILFFENISEFVSHNILNLFKPTNVYRSGLISPQFTDMFYTY